MIPERPPIASVETVREELRRLGYLDRGLDRFVLGGAATPSPTRALTAVALRLGILGGAFFGLTLTLAAVTLDPRLLSEPRDLAILGLYLTLALGLATAVAALAGGAVAGLVGRRVSAPAPPNLSRNVGVAVALVGVAYHALWWRSHAAGAPLGAQAAALGLGFGLTLVLGRFGSLAAVAVLSAGGGRLPEASLSRRHMLPLLGAIALLFGGGAATASYLGARPAAGPDFAVVPSGVRVVVLGIDGLEWRMTRQRLERGEMPALQALIDRGAVGRLRAEPEQVPAIVWTTVATGQEPAAHGIQSAGPRRLPGMKTPVPVGAREDPFASALGAATEWLRITTPQPPSAVLRSAKTFWNVASEKGLRIGVVNWWATWPADPVNGYVVTDRALFKIEKGGEADRETFPGDALEHLRPLAARAVPDRARHIDRFALASAHQLRASSPPDLEAIYLPGLDIVTMQQLGDGGASDLAGLGERLDVVRDYYRFLDGLIGEAVDRLADGDLLVLVGDPGRLARKSRDPAEGLLVLAGSVAAPGDLGVVSERDVAPTVLHLVGLPASRELSGRVLEAAFTDAFRSAHPVRVVDSYGRRRPVGPTDSSFDPQVLEELRSLGYIE